MIKGGICNKIGVINNLFVHYFLRKKFREISPKVGWEPEKIVNYRN